MLERTAQRESELAPPGATPTIDELPRRIADFATLGEALDYAAQGKRGLNFHDARGTLTQTYTYADSGRSAKINANIKCGCGGSYNPTIISKLITNPDSIPWIE